MDLVELRFEGKKVSCKYICNQNFQISDDDGMQPFSVIMDGYYIVALDFFSLTRVPLSTEHKKMEML